MIDYKTFHALAQRHGFAPVPPYADRENGPSADEVSEPTIFIDGNGDEVGMWDETQSGFYILFLDPAAFASFQNEGTDGLDASSLVIYFQDPERVDPELTDEDYRRIARAESGYAE